MGRCAESDDQRRSIGEKKRMNNSAETEVGDGFFGRIERCI